MHSKGNCFGNWNLFDTTNYYFAAFQAREAGETLFFWSNFLVVFDAHTRCECAPGYVGPSRCSRSWRDVVQNLAKASVLSRDFCGAKQGRRLRDEFEKLHEYGVTMLRANCARREEIGLVWDELKCFIGSIRVSLTAGEAVVAPR